MSKGELVVGSEVREVVGHIRGAFQTMSGIAREFQSKHLNPQEPVLTRCTCVLKVWADVKGRRRKCILAEEVSWNSWFAHPI